MSNTPTEIGTVIVMMILGIIALLLAGLSFILGLNWIAIAMVGIVVICTYRIYQAR